MKKHKINKVLIANRGEISLRIQRACDELGIGYVAVASEVDRGALFARKAKELALIGPAAARESYLNIDRLLAAAKEHDCDSVHPGYGFLSENAEFARRVIEAGLTFVGPEPESIEILGNKTAARQRVSDFGVLCTPGCSAGLSDANLASAAQEIGFPIIIKAVAGGGGRGMRTVYSQQELAQGLSRARGEAAKNFGNDDVYLEKYITEPRHVEVQIFGDHYSNLVHFGTRDCSTQRRHQKLVEEAPAPFLAPRLREKIHHAAIQAASSVNYRNAGTVEFLVKGQEFYFLEMNTRIQVEHPVTELVTGVDLVALQLRVAMGEKLPYAQSDIEFNGHAIEFRVYAEDPEAEFRPCTGTIHTLRRPRASFVREDTAIEKGDTVSPHYDAMLTKIIIRGADRSQAILRSREILKRYEIKGLPTTLVFHRWLLSLSPFRKHCLEIGFVERYFNRASVRELRASEVRDPKHRLNVFVSVSVSVSISV